MNLSVCSVHEVELSSGLWCNAARRRRPFLTSICSLYSRSSQDENAEPLIPYSHEFSHEWRLGSAGFELDSSVGSELSGAKPTKKTIDD